MIVVIYMFIGFYGKKYPVGRKNFWISSDIPSGLRLNGDSLEPGLHPGLYSNIPSGFKTGNVSFESGFQHLPRLYPLPGLHPGLHSNIPSG